MAGDDQLHRQWSILDLMSEGRKCQRSPRGLPCRSKRSPATLRLSLLPIAEERDGIDVVYELVYEAVLAVNTSSAPAPARLDLRDSATLTASGRPEWPVLQDRSEPPLGFP
jgi:hypothetical protein